MSTTIDPGIICASIQQWTGGDNNRPYVDFSNFFDRPDGNIVPGHFIFSGPLPAEELSWTPALGPYIVLGHALIDNGQELIIAPGTEVRFAGGMTLYGSERNVSASLQILGKLSSEGEANNQIHLLSHNGTPEQGDWTGIVFLETAENTSHISYTLIEHAYTGIQCKGGVSPEINNNEIIAGTGSHSDYGAPYGIRLEGGNTSAVTDNVISGYDYTDCGGMYIENSSPTVTGNTIEGNRIGLYIEASSAATIATAPKPLISENSILNSIQRSFYLDGISDDTRNPQPVINNNTIISPSVANNSFYTSGYGTSSQGSTIVIDRRRSRYP